MNVSDSGVPARKNISRRDFLKLLKTGAIDLALLIAGGAGWSFLIEPNLVKVEHVNLNLPRLGSEFSGIRIAQISDIHMGGWMNAERLQHIIDLVKTQKPDLFFLTGDFLIGHTFDQASEEYLQNLIDILSPLAKSIPSFGVLGNHDYWTNADAVRGMMKASGMMELSNSVFTMTRGNQNFHLCGVDDIWEKHARLDDVVEQLPDDSAAILLAHEPDFADVSAETGRFDLQVSGHSHGGQVVIPLYGAPILPYLGQKYPSGLYKVGNMLQYTNRGVGMIEPAVRFNCPPEITLFILESN
jgi:predicted MPP superfamily phosphohydrolase